MYGEAVFLCRRNNNHFIPWLAVIVGSIILLGLLLPRWLWWLLCGLALVAGGLLLLRKK